MPKMTLRDFFKYMTKNKNRIVSLKKDDEIVENSEDMSKVLNQYLSSVFTHMNLTTFPDADQVFREKEDERSTNLNITSQ